MPLGSSFWVAALPTIDEIYREQVWRVFAFFAYRLGSREDAEDLTQATFERAARALPRYDKRRASVATWLLAIAQNLLVDHHRKRVGRDHRPLEDADFEHPALVVGDAAAFALGLDPDLAAALTALTDRDREIVALRYGADLTGPEIAELKGLSLANVQQILSRALRRMRAVIEERRSVSER